MKFILMSTIACIRDINQIQSHISAVNAITFLPLAMPQEMDNNEEWETFYGKKGQLREIYEKPFDAYDKQITWINIFTMSKMEIIKIIELSQCIVLVGGDALALKVRMNQFPEIYQILQKSDKLIIGVSAGAKIWFSQMFVEHEDTKGNIHLEIASGMAYFSTKQVIAVHVEFSQEQLYRLFSLLKQPKIDEIIALGESGVLFYDTKNEQLEVYGDVKFFE